MSNDVDVMQGIATLISTASIGSYTPDDVVDQTGTAVVLKDMPDSPDRCIAVICYTTFAQPGMPLDQMNVQIRSRGARNNPLDADVLAGQVYALLQGLTYQQFGSVGVDQILLRSSIPLGVDGNSRWERSDNYTLDVDVPATANRPL